MTPTAGFIVHPIAAQIEVRIDRAMTPLPDDVEQRVETLWQAAIRRVADGGAGQLFNGRVFSADTITPARIGGHLTEFRRIVAQMDDPSLAPILDIRPLAVCGVVLGRDGVVIGRRPTGAVYQPGMWQLPPAGSVDSHAARPDGRIDLIGQLATEFTEELGLPATAIRSTRPLCAVEHPGSRVTDLGIAIATDLTADEITVAHRANGNREYDPLRVLAPDAVPGFVADAGDDLVPPAREFLARVGLLAYGLSPPAGP
ncbi:MAG: NUDIX hydrolase [Acetobacteraceae bacterium]